MRALLIRLSCILSLSIAGSGSAVTMDWTPIGNPGNACDPQSQGCFGAVGYDYNIGTYEVTNAQYAEFLNAKAASDPLGLYNPLTGAGNWGITRIGSPGSYSYTLVAGLENRPVVWLSFYDALRFANWMNNGQGNGDTETGAYTLDGTAYPIAGNSVTRNAGATIALANENEWYKAAHFSPETMEYFDYPTGSNALPACAFPSATPNTANCTDLAGNVLVGITDVGSYTGSPSPYGTYDQAGNVWEWNESFNANANPTVGRGIRGSGWKSIDMAFLGASFRAFAPPSAEANEIGFRLVLIPEPSTGLLVIAGLLGFKGRRRRG